MNRASLRNVEPFDLPNGLCMRYDGRPPAEHQTAWEMLQELGVERFGDHVKVEILAFTPQELIVLSAMLQQLALSMEHHNVA